MQTPSQDHKISGSRIGLLYDYAIGFYILRFFFASPSAFAIRQDANGNAIGALLVTHGAHDHGLHSSQLTVSVTHNG